MALSLFASKSPAKTVADILASFTTAIDSLNEVIQVNTSSIAEQEQVIKAALDSKAESEKEISAASTAVQNLRALIGQ